MAHSTSAIKVYIEAGKKRTFAGALAWPGWCRAGRDEAAALQALVDAGPRYSRALHGSELTFRPPADTSALVVAERVAGDSTTDFGAPSIAPPSDAQPVDEDELRRLQALLRACWRAFDAATEAAVGKDLRGGPRGGGRSLDGIVRHVLGAEASYIARLAWKRDSRDGESLEDELDRTRQAALDALAAAARGETPTRGPRGGVIWSPRYFVRRAAWHVLDHVWEIEDRVIESPGRA